MIKLNVIGNLKLNNNKEREHALNSEGDMWGWPSLDVMRFVCPCLGLTITHFIGNLDKCQIVLIIY